MHVVSCLRRRPCLRNSARSSVFAIAAAPWFNGLVTPACGFIVFVNLVSRGGCHLRGSLFALELEFMQARVNASHCQQLGVIPALDNLSIVHDEDYIGGTDRRQMMCDHD